MLLTSQNVVVVLVIEEKKDATNRIGKKFFLRLVLRYMSLYKCILNARSFISAFFLFFFFFFFTQRRQQEQPPVVVSSPCCMWVPSLPKRQSFLNSLFS
jgi:hypothetical protein